MYGRKRGRPKKENAKTHRFTYRMTEKQYETLQHLAISNGFRTISAYLDKVLEDERERDYIRCMENL